MLSPFFLFLFYLTKDTSPWGGGVPNQGGSSLLSLNLLGLARTLRDTPKGIPQCPEQPLGVLSELSQLRDVDVKVVFLKPGMNCS